MEGNFASTDARYRGKGLVGKSGARVKANFTTPLSNKSKKKVSVSISAGEKVVKVEKVKEKVSVCCASEDKVVKGEKAKGKIDAGVVSVVGEDSSDSQCEGARHIPKEKLEGFCKHLGDGRGECYCGVVVFLALLLCRC